MVSPGQKKSGNPGKMAHSATGGGGKKWAWVAIEPWLCYYVAITFSCEEC